MSDLSDDALAWIAERPGVASDERVTEIATELLRLRAVVGAQATGPDQDEAAAWRIREVGQQDRFTTSPAAARGAELRGAGVAPLVLLVRAREGQATAPRADEDALRAAHATYHCETGNLLGADDCEWLGCRWWAVATDLVEQGWRPAAAPGAETTGGAP